MRRFQVSYAPVCPSPAPKPDAAVVKDASRLAWIITRSYSVGSSVRLDAERAVRLLATSTKSAVLLAREWHVLETFPLPFESISFFREVAAASRYHFVMIARPKSGGHERLHILARVGDMTDEEYVDCIEDSS